MAVVAVSVFALIGVIVSMWLTEYLAVSIRWPVVLVLLFLVSLVWTSVLRRQVERLVEASVAGQGLDAHHGKIGIRAGELEPEIQGLGAHGLAPR